MSQDKFMVYVYKNPNPDLEENYGVYLDTGRGKFIKLDAYQHPGYTSFPYYEISKLPEGREPVRVFDIGRYGLRLFLRARNKLKQRSKQFDTPEFERFEEITCKITKMGWSSLTDDEDAERMELESKRYLKYEAESAFCRVCDRLFGFNSCGDSN
jgi:hypothetical protein